MDDELQKTFNVVAGKIGAVVENALTLTVETWYLTVDGDAGASGAAAKPDFDNKSRPMARTEIKVDGDSKNVVPMRTGDDGNPEVDKELLGLHNENVQIAREYRSEITNTLIGLVSSLRQ